MWLRRSLARPLPPRSPRLLSSAERIEGERKYPVLHAELRTSQGSRPAREFRLARKVPGVIYGKDEIGNNMKISVLVNELDILREVRNLGLSFENTVYEVVLNGEVHRVTPRQLQVDPLSERPLNINFLRQSSKTRYRIPIQYLNEDMCTDMKRGNFLIPVNKFIECVCDNDIIPRTLTIDVANAKLGDIFRTSAIMFPPGVRPSINVPADYVLSVLSSE